MFGEGNSVLTTDNGYQWQTVFTGSYTSCIRIAKAFMKEGYKEEPEESIKQWFV